MKGQRRGQGETVSRKAGRKLAGRGGVYKKKKHVHVTEMMILPGDIICTRRMAIVHAIYIFDTFIPSHVALSARGTDNEGVKRGAEHCCE